MAGLVMTRVFIGKRAWWNAWFASNLTIAGVMLFGFAGLFPNLLPSNIDPAYSMTIYNSASSTLTLKIMLGVALLFVPVIIFYQSWIYRLFKGKVIEKDLIHYESY